MLKALKVIGRAQRALRPLALAHDLAVADLVAAGLPRPGAIAINLAGHLLGLGAIAFDKELPALFARPALGVQPGVHHQPAGAKGEALQISQPPDLEIIIGAQLIGKLFGIERPAFGKGVEGEDRADQRQAVGKLALPHVPGDAFVEGEIGKIILAVQIGGAQVDPEPPGDRAILAPRPAIGPGRARLLGERQAPHLERGIDQLVEGARHLRLDPGDALVDEGEDFRAPGIALGKLVAWVFGKRAHPLAHAAGGVADLLEDRIHARVDFLKLGQALAVDLLRAQGRGGRGADRPGVIFLAHRLGPHPGMVARLAALGLEFGKLALERGDDAVRDDPLSQAGAAFRPRQARGGERADIALARAADARLHLRDRLVEQEGGRDHPQRMGGPDPVKLAIEQARHLGEPIEIEARVLGRLERLGRGKEARVIEVAADILDHHVRGIAPAAHRHIAIGQGHAFKRAGKGGLDDLEADLLIAGQPGARIGSRFFQQLLERCRIGLPPLLARGAEGAAPGGIFADIDAKPGGPARFVGEHAVGDGIERGVGRKAGKAAGCRRGAARGAAGAGGQQGKRGSPAKPGKGLAAGDGGKALSHAPRSGGAVGPSSIALGTRPLPARKSPIRRRPCGANTSKDGGLA
ncbi:MAG: hypothetical protein KatS3mg120_0518 [Erythrobacter sp.]|nr:MAG: hypothetical protein KatS3mg120_0518 [Erythrobacter sp.]